MSYIFKKTGYKSNLYSFFWPQIKDCVDNTSDTNHVRTIDGKKNALKCTILELVEAPIIYVLFPSPIWVFFLVKTGWKPNKVRQKLS